ncbi:hypothetical protein HED60_18015 [Planctomycetales bacterium ZRK34]|nr:hypothetical protein HED60_18015 [Planctomycetales bacterium ZRK34]
MNAPIVNGSNGGRDASGRFTRGNPGGPGNPYIRQVAALRAAVLEAVDAESLAAIVHALVEKAKAGDVVAAREIFDRCLGKPKQTLDLDVDVGPKAEKCIDEMTDMELAEAMVKGGALDRLPPILRRKVENIYGSVDRFVGKIEPKRAPRKKIATKKTKQHHKKTTGSSPSATRSKPPNPRNT